MESKKLAIVGIFYDGYYDVWEDFLELKERFWKDCPYPLYIINQCKKLSFKKKYDVTVINAGADAEYSKKVQTALEKIDADYLLLLLEDFFMSHEIVGGVLDETIKLMVEHDVKYYTMPLSEFLVIGGGKIFNGISYIYDISPKRKYTLSCQPAIWEKNFLRKSIGTGNYNAWIFEGMYLKSQKAHTEEFLKQCKIDSRNILGLKHGVLQGYLFPNLVKYYTSIGYQLKNKRPILPKSIRMKRWIRFHLPDCILNTVKKSVTGQSVISKYSKEIDIQMTSMELK